MSESTANDEELEKIRAKKLEVMKKELQDNPGGSGDNWPAEPVPLTEQNFEEFIKQYPLVAVDCWAPWCGPCRMVAPIIDELAKEYQGKIVFGKLNTDENQGIALKFNIMSIPTLILFKEGKPISNIVGFRPKAELKRSLDAAL